VDPITVDVTIARPRDEVFEYLADIANHAEFTGEYLHDFHLERLESSGVGAAASYRIMFPLGRTWGESVIVELDAPHLVRLEGQTGRLGRIKTKAAYRMTQAGRDMTRVEYSFEAVPGSAGDRLKDLLGFRPWLTAKSRGGLQRLAKTLEEGRPSTHAATVAAG